MAKTVLDPGFEYVLVVDTNQIQNIEGIEMPDNVRQKDMLTGYVIAVGPDCRRAKEKDTVMFGPYAGKLLAFDGMEFRVLKEGQIEVWVRIIPDPPEPDSEPPIATLEV